MNTKRRTRAVVLVGLVFFGGLVLAVVVGFAYRPSTSPSGIGSGGGVLGSPTASFAIEGDLTELVAPGVRIPIDLSITNGTEASMVVTNLKVTVAAVDAPNASSAFPCTVDDFDVSQVPHDFEVRVSAKTTATLDVLGLPGRDWPSVGLLDTPSNQDGCKGASLTLAYFASGRAVTP